MSRQQARLFCLESHLDIRAKLARQGHGAGSPYMQDVEASLGRALAALGGLAGRW